MIMGLLLLMLLTPLAQAEVLMEVNTWETPEGWSPVIWSGDWGFLVGQGREVWGYSLQNQRILADFMIGPLSHTPTALLQADLNGDGLEEIVMGTDGIGALAVFAYENGSWARQGPLRYLWGEVLSIFSLGDGRIAALSASGALHVLDYRSGQMHHILRTDPDGPLFSQIQSLKTASGWFLVGLTHENTVAVYQLQGNRLTRVWETYPWGRVLSLSLADLTGDGREEIVVNTDQRVIYIYKQEMGAFVNLWQGYGEDFGFESTIHLSLTGRDWIGFGEPVQFYQFSGSSMRVAWAPPRTPRMVQRWEDQILLFTGERVHAYQPWASRQLQVFLLDRDLTHWLSLSPRDRNLYVTGASLATTFGFRLEFADESFTLYGPGLELSGEVGGRVLMGSGEEILLSLPVFAENGQLFLPVGIFSEALGFEMTFEGDTLRLTPRGGRDET